VCGRPGHGPPPLDCEGGRVHALVLAALLCAKAVDDAVGLVMREQHIAGLSVAAYSHGRVTCLRGYGFARIGSRTPATPDTTYRIGSLTKSFTGAAVLRLAALGKLELTLPIGRYVS